MKNTSRKFRKAFSLIEIIIAMALFLTVVLLISDVFLGVSRTEEKTLVSTKVANDLSHSLTQLEDLVRNKTINYEKYGGSVALAQNELNLLDENGKNIVVKVAAGYPNAENTVLYVDYSDIDAENSYALTPNDIKITKLTFFISPEKDPYKLDPVTQLFGADEQPRITVAISAISTAGVESARKQIDMQTTISLRQYGR